MKYNTNYGTRNEEKITYAPDSLVINGVLVTNPRASQYHLMGYKTLHLAYPTEPAGEGKHWERDGWDETDTDITKLWKAVDDPVEVKRYSVPDLFFWLRGYDEQNPDNPKGQKVKDWLDAQNLYTIAVTTRVVSADNELFAPTLAAIKEAIGFTDEEIASALAYAETTQLPDQIQ